MKDIKNFLTESTCGGYDSSDIETVGDALLNSLGDYDPDDLAADYEEIGWDVFDIEYAAEELDIDSDDLFDYIDNYAGELEEYLGI